MASKLPVHPVWYNAILKAHELNCSDEMVSLAALASTQQSIFVSPYGPRYAADATRPWFFDGTSDHLSQLNALHPYVRTKFQGNIDMEQWCFDAFLSGRVLEEVLLIRQQLLALARGFLVGGPRSTPFGNETYNTNIRKALAQSFFHQSAFYTRKGDDIYVTVHDNHPAGIHPEIALVKCIYEWVIYNTFVYSGKQYMQTVTAVDPTWLIVRASDSSNLIISTNTI
jgi:pre-mRNA-splicing factor ATP-dependent RNA helicase DHX15/PRP43